MEHLREYSKPSSCPRKQTNNSNNTSPNGPTTLVINSSPAATAAVNPPVFVNPPGDVASTPASPPVQPTGLKCPITVISGKSRAFNPSWYTSYPWLEYSRERDACYCYSCRLFGCGAGSKCEKTFTVVGFRDWKHAAGKSGVLYQHDISYAYKQSVVAWNQYKSNNQHKNSIAEQLGNARAEQISQNCHYIKTPAEIVLLCSHQEIALCGHHKGEESMNRGNYLEILNLIAHHDPVINERLTNGPKHAKYTSPEIQNSLINVMGAMVRQSICSAVQKAGAFTLLADETKDCSKKEQLAIVLHYVDINTVNLHEHFLTYMEATSLDARSLSEFILNALRKNELYPACIVSQGYDGASVISGHCGGVQKYVRDIAPHAPYVHCYAHCLNLVLVDSKKRVSEASDFFSILETLYVFLSRSVTHAIFIKKQFQLKPNCPQRQLQRLSDTRWSCRFLAVDAVCSTFESVLATLEEIANGEDISRAMEATGIWSQVQTFKFLVSLIIFQQIFSCTKSLSDLLQCRQLDLAKAADLVLATKTTVKEFRTDSKWDSIYKYALDVAHLHSIAVEPS